MLKIDKLNKTYSNGIQALNNVSLEIDAGMFGLLGPNGAGKSTLMRTLASIQDADSGEVTLNGINLLQNKQEVRKRLGYLPQEFGFYPKIRANQLLDQLAQLKGVASKKNRKELVEHLLQKVNLWDVRKNKISEFSGGMKQRIGIAQALIGDPQLIIVDEPTAGLDPAERNRFHNILSEIGENTAVLLSTHIVDDVRDLCTNMAIINKGRILLTGNPLDIIETLRGNIWEKMIEKDELSSYEENYDVISSRLYAGKVVIHVFALDEPADSFSQTEPGLEDGTSLNKTQVDSLSDLYNDQLEFIYEREDGKTVVIFMLPENNKNEQSSSFTFIAPETKSNSDTNAIDDMEKVFIFKDTLGHEITKSAFQQLMRELGGHPAYSISLEDNKRIMTMSPPTSPEAKLMMEKLSEKKATLNEMIGNPFPFEKMTDIEGNNYNHDSFEGKIVVLNYWFVECAPCIREMPHLNELVAEFSNNEEIVFIAPSLSDQDKIESMLEKRPFDYALIPDADNHSNSIGIAGYPTHIVVNQDGIVTMLETGYYDDTIDKLRMEIKRLKE